MNYLVLIQTLIQAIHTVEAMMPTSAGKQKFDAAIAIVEGVVGSVGPMLPQLVSIATMVVNGLRAVGTFKTPAPAPAVPTPAPAAQ